MQVAVIGGGVVGVCSAYFLALAGHEVVVVERQNNVAELASFGNGGLLAPSSASPWAAPGMASTVFSFALKADAPMRMGTRMNRPLWRWLRQWRRECTAERFLINHERMQRVAQYSQRLMQELRTSQPMDFEQTSGHLLLWRDAAGIAAAQPLLDWLAEQGTPHALLRAEEAREIEPGLAADAPLAGALHLPQDEAGNCPLFAKHMKAAAQRLGVTFHFNTEVRGLQPEGGQVALDIDERRFQADAVVIATGAEAPALLAPLGVKVPLVPVKGYSATAVLRDFDEAPRGSLMDETHKVAITRLGGRVRIAGLAEIGAADATVRDAAIRNLIRVGADWFPNAANYNTASFWAGLRPMLPDGAPLICASPVKNVFLNIGHGAHGWAMAAGSGKLLADLVSGRAPEIDTDGLTLTRYG